MRKLALPFLAACATFGVVAIPASAGIKLEKKQNKSIGNIKGVLGGVKSAIKNIEDINLGQTASVNNAHADIAALKATVTAVITTATKALGDINSALTNSTTGLVGLNLARPQFGTFLGTGVIAGGTGQVTGASGPKADATRLAAGTYLVDFGNDVSKRALHTTAAPGAGAVVVEAVNCKNAPGQCPGGDDPNKVLVLTYVLASNANNLLAAGVAADATFTVTAISG